MSLPHESNLPVRSKHGLVGFKPLGLFSFCSEWLSEQGAGFRVNDGAVDVDKVDDFDSEYVVVSENVLADIPSILH